MFYVAVAAKLRLAEAGILAVARGAAGEAEEAEPGVRDARRTALSSKAWVRRAPMYTCETICHILKQQT